MRNILLTNPYECVHVTHMPRSIQFEYTEFSVIPCNIHWIRLPNRTAVTFRANSNLNSIWFEYISFLTGTIGIVNFMLCVVYLRLTKLIVKKNARWQKFGVVWFDVTILHVHVHGIDFLTFYIVTWRIQFMSEIVMTLCSSTWIIDEIKV